MWTDASVFAVNALSKIAAASGRQADRASVRLRAAPVKRNAVSP